ncbi:MAG: hypothetical protein WC668_00080 [Patescibacteria group bacterium]|jgi:hypothetical protein
MNDEDKLRRHQIRQLSQAKDHAKRRQIGRKRQAGTEDLTKNQFEKKFPHLSIKVWYAQRCFVGKGYDW